MNNKSDILVIGGGPAGRVSAMTAKKYYPDKSILLLKNIEHGCVPCGIPYMISSLKNPKDNETNDDLLEKSGIKVVIDEVIRIDKINKEVITVNGKYSFDKLILALGSVPVTPPILGIDKRGVYSIYKDMVYLEEFAKKIKESKSVLIVGGGFIGVEFADEISKITGVKVFLVEMLPNILTNSFDVEFSGLVEQKLLSHNVQVLKQVRVKEIIGEEKVEAVLLSDGQKITVDSVILGMGACPNTKLAFDAQISLDQSRGIWVDEFMRTSDQDIFAVGDCAGKRDFFSHKCISVMLASTAAAEARVAGANLYGLKVLRENRGTIAVYSTYIDGLVLGSAGFTEYNARREGFEVIIGKAEGMSKHPTTLPDVSNIKVKLVFSRKSGILLGGQIAGGMSCAELMNFISIAVQKRMTAEELETLQIATHPYLTSSPVVYPIIIAAQEASRL